MSTRRLAAVIACRANSTRLYAKPLQNLVTGYSILDQKIATFEALPEVVSTSVIAIAEGIENLPYQQYAEQRGLPYLFGSSSDILSRLVNGGLLVGATDVLRVTSENPFIWWEQLAPAWAAHTANDNHLTVTDGCPYGAYFEIIRLDALLEAQHEATGYQREACTQFFRDQPQRYRTQLITPPKQRLDVRLTVDNPEDLVVCRRIYQQLADQAPLIPMQDIIDAWDADPLFRSLQQPFISGHGIWVNNQGCVWAPDPQRGQPASDDQTPSASA